MDFQLFINLLLSAATVTQVAVGFSIIFGVTRSINFAHGIVFTIGAYSALIFSEWLSFPNISPFIIAIAVSIISGCIIDLIIYRPLRHREASSLILLLVSLGIYIVLQNVISLVFGDDTKSLRFGRVVEGINVLGARITGIQVIIIISSVILVAAVWVGLNKSRLGMAMRAVANDPELAMISGIDSDRIIIWAFAVGSALAGVAGVLVALDIDMTPTMGLNALMLAVVAVIIGGVGSIPGMALGAFLLAGAQQFAAWKFGSQWQEALTFAILLVFLLIRPQGFMGRKPKKANL